MGEKEDIVNKQEVRNQDGVFSKVILTYDLTVLHRLSFPPIMVSAIHATASLF